MTEERTFPNLMRKRKKSGCKKPKSKKVKILPLNVRDSVECVSLDVVFQSFNAVMLSYGE